MTDTRHSTVVVKASGWLLFYALLALPVGLGFASWGILLLTEFAVSIALWKFDDIMILCEFPVAILFIYISLPPLIGGFVAILDLFAKKQALIVSDEQCIDSRFTPISFSFSDVQHAIVLFGRGGPAGINFQIKGTTSSWLNDFRIGCWSMLGEKRRGRLCVSIVGLSQRPEQLAELLLAKAQLHGATTVNRSPIADAVQKLMPK